MKKLSLLLALCLMLSIFAGCGGEPAPTTVPTTAPQPTTVPTEPTTVPTEPPAPKVIDYALEVPEGFFDSVVEDTLDVMSSPDAPMDSSTITVELLPLELSVLDLSEEEFESRILAALSEPAEPEETEETADPEETEETEETEEPEETEDPDAPEDFNLLAMSAVQVDGWPALFCEYNLVYRDYASHIIRFEVVTDAQNYVFTFTDNTDDNEWLDAFEESADTIDLILDTERITLSYEGLTRYDLAGGLEIYAEDGMEHHRADGFTDCIGNRNVILLMMADNKQTNNLTEMTPADYAELLRSTNDLDAFETDIYGNLFTTFYSTDENGMEYYNMICVKETEDSFWVIQLACGAGDQASYAKAFPLWASSIR